MKIAIVGIGYVGLSLSVLLSQQNEVVAVDILKDKVEKINKRISPIIDPYVDEFFKTKKLNLRATLDYQDAFKESEFIIICTPTNYDEKENHFDTTIVENVIKNIIDMKLDTTMVIKSTVPVGFTETMRKKYNTTNIIFSPEFLREGKALYDNLYPSRIIVGDYSNNAKKFAKILKGSAIKEDIPIKFMSSTEAEAVKLFSNTYLALRIAYFNELDTYAEMLNLNTKNILEGVCLDDRIGNFYNNPSFGYGGYCLPKDSKQLKTNYKDVPEDLITAIVNSNVTRKKHIATEILKHKPDVIGFYKLNMKKEADNFRNSAIFDIINLLKKECKNIIIYEPTIEIDSFENCEIINNIEEFKKMSSIVVANRMDDMIKDIKYKVYTRDVFGRD